MMRSKAMVTGLTIAAGLAAANATPALAGPGGFTPEGPGDQMGGVSAEPGLVSTASTAEYTVEQQKQLLQQAIENPDMSFTALPVYTPTGDIVVENKQGGEEMVDPLTIEYAGQLAAYAGVSTEGGKSHIEMLAADKAKVMEYIGHRVIDIQDPQRFIVERTLHLDDNTGPYPQGFTDGQELFGVMP